MLESQSLYVLIGGPVFTIILSALAFLIIEKYKTIYAYPFVLFQMFMRSFSLLFGGFNNQDEAKISIILGIGPYTVGIIVILILFLLVLSASYKLKIDIKYNSYLITMCTLCELLVIATYEHLKWFHK
jgi:hypothetical protein